MSDQRPPLPLIDVTEQMTEAGLEVLMECYYGTDLRFLVNSIYRAMAYAAMDPQGPAKG